MRLNKTRILSIFIIGLFIGITLPQTGFLENVRADPANVTLNLNSPPTNPTCSFDGSDNVLIVHSYDPDEDKIRYGISWENNQDIDIWTDYFNSSNNVEIDCSRKNGTVGVIAEDEHGLQSEWISVKSKNKVTECPILNWFLEKLIQCFPFFEKILNQIVL